MTYRLAVTAQGFQGSVGKAPPAVQISVRKRECEKRTTKKPERLMNESARALLPDICAGNFGS